MSKQLWNKCQPVQTVLAAILLSSLSTSAGAVPFELRATARLEIEEGDDRDGIDGATITVVHSGNTLARSSDPNTGEGRASSDFDDFTMTAEITQRPDGAADILNWSVASRAVANNFFSPRTENDRVEFVSGTFSTNGTNEVLLDSIWIDLGSQGLLSGTDPIEDLSFFESLFGQSLISGASVGVEIQDRPFEARYALTNLMITVVASPDEGVAFLRADANSDGAVNADDPGFLLNFLFGILAATPPPCDAAADANGDGRMNIADASFIANFIFGIGPATAPRAPHPDCAASPEEVLACEASPGCSE